MTPRASAPADPRDVVGCVLAGGRSRRMGAPDKGLRTVAGRPMAAVAIARLGEAAATVLISANGDPARFASFGLEVVPDGAHAGAGPLAGVLAALDRMAAIRPTARFLATLPSDAPFLPAGLVEGLVDAADASTIAVAASESGLHPVAAVWPVGMREALAAALDAGERRVGAFVAARPHRRVPFPPLRLGDALVDPFLNVNTPEDLARAEAFAAALGPEWR